MLSLYLKNFSVVFLNLVRENCKSNLVTILEVQESDTGWVSSEGLVVDSVTEWEQEGRWRRERIRG